MKTKFLLIVAMVFGISISNADAQIKQRSQTQKYRIKQGVRSSELTRAETKNLINDRKEIRQDVKLAKSDGKVTSGEKRIIRK